MMLEGALHLGAALRQAKVVCLFIHGRGQSPEAMQAHVVSRLRAPDVAFVLPRAKGGSWYAARAVDGLTSQTRGELESSLGVISKLVAALPENLPLVIAGFSQGACLALEYAMKHGPWAGALVSFTGCRVGIASDDRPRSNLNGMPVFLSGSDNDPWISAAAFGEAAADLVRARSRFHGETFPGRDHEVGDEEIAALQDILARLAMDCPPSGAIVE
jgi:phospholipase/carboxylesterase